jgi:ubiquitin-activating enzyme E1
MNILIIGLRGLGIETAKNLILAGPHRVVVHDDRPVAVADLGANFYVTENDLGKPRSSSVLAKLVDLNPNVSYTLVLLFSLVQN